jgi:hypothetical protein
MLKRLIYSAAVVAFVAIASTGSTSCSGGTGGGSGGGSGGSGGSGGGAADPNLVCDASPPATLLSKVHSDILIPSCQTGCHMTTSTDGSDSYGVYTTTAGAFGQVGKKSLYAGTELTLKVIDPNGLSTSTMWLKVLAHAKSPSGKNLGGEMPLGRTALTAVQKQLLKDWICSGAKM